MSVYDFLVAVFGRVVEFVRTDWDILVILAIAAGAIAVISIVASEKG